MDKLEKDNGFKRLNREKLVPILPNLITTAGLILGLASIMSSISIIGIADYSDFNQEIVFRKFWWSTAFIGIALLVDSFDGKVARALGTDSNFGTSYDSLSDLISFGVAPGVLIYVWGLSNYGKIGLMSIFFYVVCVALRLARFNIQSKDNEKDKFMGLPSPMAAGLIFAPILLFTEFQIPPSDIMLIYYLFAAPLVGLIMVSEIPYMKLPNFSRFGNFNMLVVGAIIITAVITNPGIMTVAVIYTYFLLGLFVCVYKIFRNKILADKEAEIFNG